MTLKLQEVALDRVNKNWNKKKDSSLSIIKSQGHVFNIRQSTVKGLGNRERDKKRVEKTLGLPEFGSKDVLIYLMNGNWSDEIIDEHGDDMILPKTLIATGYKRVVYGDHGPYIELQKDQICWETFPEFKKKPDFAYYDEYFAMDGTMLYAQNKFVSNKKNPPKDGKWSCNNNLDEGYANYLPNMFYIEASRDKLYTCCKLTDVDLGEEDDDSEKLDTIEDEIDIYDEQLDELTNEFYTQEQLEELYGKPKILDFSGQNFNFHSNPLSSISLNIKEPEETILSEKIALDEYKCIINPLLDEAFMQNYYPYDYVGSYSENYNQQQILNNENYTENYNQQQILNNENYTENYNEHYFSENYSQSFISGPSTTIGWLDTIKEIQ